MTTKNNVKTVNLPPKRFNLVDFYIALIQTETPGSPQHVAAVAWFRDTAKLADRVTFYTEISETIDE